MRLICPNCDAEYEVPDGAIPPEGRDVQCSNCGVTWFFDPMAPLEADVETAEDFADPVPVEAPEVIAPDPQPEPTQARVTPPPAPKVNAPVIDPEDDYSPEPAPESEPQPVPQPAQRRALDSGVKDVLREEAEFEARARAEDQGVEVQGDLGLAAPPPPLPADPDDAAVDDIAGGGASRRDLLPDIEEINSTLRATSERGADAGTYAEDAANEETRRRGFRSGFGLALLVLGGLAALYSYSAGAIETFPGLEGPINNFVAVVNQLRVGLQDLVSSAVAKMG